MALHVTVIHPHKIKSEYDCKACCLSMIAKFRSTKKKMFVLFSRNGIVQKVFGL